MVDSLYRLGFMTMPSDLTVKESAHLDAHGVVRIRRLKLQDQPSTRVCLAVQGFERCVSFGQDGPAALIKLVDDWFADAVQRTSEAPAK